MKNESAHLFEKYGIGRNVRSDGRLELALRGWVRLLRAIGTEAMSRQGIPLPQRLRSLRLGFRPRNARLYELGGGRHKLYVPDFAYSLRGYGMNGFLNPIVGNKLVLSHVLAAHGIPHPPVLGTISRGRAFPMQGGSPSTPLTAFFEWTSGGKTAVLRPHWSGSGEGVFFLSRTGASWLVNRREAPERDVEQLVGGLDRYIATAFVEQGEYSRTIQPATTNTLRVLALSDKSGPFVSSVVHRFGTTRSFPIDNFHQGVGGLCAAVDAAAGQLGEAVSLDGKLKRTTHSHHPETGARIKGVEIPGLAQALEGVLAAMRCFPEAVCIGWDLVITGSGFSILEANSPPGLAVFQAHEPLLADARTAEVFGRHFIGTIETKKPGNT